MVAVEHTEHQIDVRPLERMLELIKDRILSKVSHEFKTPLTSIIGYSEVLLNDPSLPEDLKQSFLSTIKKEGERLAELVDELLSFSMLENGQIHLNQKEGDIIPVIQCALKRLRPQVEDKNLSVRTSYDKPSIVADFDRDRMFEVLLHIMSNAIKFSPAGGHIEVVARTHCNDVEILVADSGEGIPVNDASLIFQGFYRVHRPGEETRGMGIGLAIAKRLMELHQGNIFVNTQKRSGCTFALRFPQTRSATQ